MSIVSAHFFFRFCGARLAAAVPRLRLAGLSFRRLDLDPVEIAFAFDVLQPLEQPRHRRAVAMPRQQQEFLAHLGAVERLFRRALEAFDAAGERAAVVERHGDRRDDAVAVLGLVRDRNRHALRQRADRRIVERFGVERGRIARVAVMRQRHAERQRILRHHQVGRRGDVVDRRHLLVAGDMDRGDVGRIVAVLAAQILDRLHRGVRGDVDRKALEHDAERRPFLAEPARQRRDVVLAAIDVEKAERPFQHALRPGEAFFGEARRQHAAFGGAAEVQPLDHRAGARARELQKPAGQRAGDAERVGHRLVVELQQPPDRDRAAERPGGAGRMEAAALVVVLGRPPDADHHLGARDHRRDQLAPADAALLRHRQRRHAHGGARMHAGVRPGQIVHLEGMRQRAVGEGRHRRLQARAAGREDAALAARAAPPGVIDDDPAPRQMGAESDRRDGVGDGVLGALDHRRRQVLKAKRGCVFRQLQCFLRHPSHRLRALIEVASHGSIAKNRLCLRGDKGAAIRPAF